MWYDCNIIAQAVIPTQQRCPHVNPRSLARRQRKAPGRFDPPCVPRTREKRDQLLFALLKVAAPIGLVVAMLLVAAPEPGNVLAAASVP